MPDDWDGWMELEADSSAVDTPSQKKKIYIPSLLARAVENDVPIATCEDVNFGYCAGSSCTRVTSDSEEGPNAKVASCACQSVRGSETQARVSFTTPGFGLMIANSPRFVVLLDDYLNSPQSTSDFEAYEGGVCDALKGGEFYPDLAPDAISTPDLSTDTLSLDAKIHPQKTCGSDLSVVTCTGAPCFRDPHAPGALNMSCLCPIYP